MLVFRGVDSSPMEFPKLAMMQTFPGPNWWRYSPEGKLVVWNPRNPPSNNPFHKGILGIQTTGPQTTKTHFLMEKDWRCIDVAINVLGIVNTYRYIPGTRNNQFKVDVWWNNHFLCTELESSNWNNNFHINEWFWMFQLPGKNIYIYIPLKHPKIISQQLYGSP